MPKMPGIAPDLKESTPSEDTAPEAMSVQTPVAPMVDEPEQDVSSLLAPDLRQEGDDLEEAYRSTAEQSPDQIAQAIRGARVSSLPAELLAKSQKLRAVVEPPTMDLATFGRRAPVLAKKLTGDPMTLGVARDDLPGLAALEEEFARFKRQPKLSAGEPQGVMGKLFDTLLADSPERRTARGIYELEARRQGQTLDQYFDDQFGPEFNREARRKINAFTGGLAGATGGMLAGLDWITGTKAFAEMSMAMRQGAMQAQPEDPTFAEKVASGFGSMVTFWVPGLGVARGAGALVNISVRAASWAGVAVSSMLEAFTEAGSVYQDMAASGKNEREASRAATLTFLGNLPLLVVTNRLGLFGSGSGLVRRLVAGAGMEGTQEASQEAISSLATGQEVKLKDLIEAFGVGAITGGPVAVATSKLGEKMQPSAPVSPEEQFLGGLERRVAGLKTTQRDPETVGGIIRDLAQQYGTPERAYLPVEAVQTLFQSSPESTAFEILDGLGITETEYVEAERLGLPISIPLERIASLVESPVWQSVRNNVSFEPKPMMVEQEAGQYETETPKAESKPSMPKGADASMLVKVQTVDEIGKESVVEMPAGEALAAYDKKIELARGLMQCLSQ